MNDVHEHFDRHTQLRELRPSIEGLELDRPKPRSSAWRNFVRSRTAVVAALATGALMGTPATAFGISGLASSGSASTAQYGSAGTPEPMPTSGVNPFGVIKASNTEAMTPQEQVTQAGPSTAGHLPFTGFGLIAVLLIGLVLLVPGLLARRMAGHSDASSS